MDYKDIGIPINTLSIYCLLGTWQILSNTLQGIFVFSPMYCTVPCLGPFDKKNRWGGGKINVSSSNHLTSARTCLVG